MARHRLDEIAHGAGRLVQRRALGVGQAQLEDLLDAGRAELDRHADEEAVDPVLALEQHAARQDALLVEQDRVDHLDDRRARRVVGAAGLEQADDLGAAVGGALLDRRHAVRRRAAR